MLVSELINKFSELGSLQSELEVWDVQGHKFKIVDVYNSDDIDENVTCIDVEKVD